MRAPVAPLALLMIAAPPAMADPTLPLTVRGNEPFWSLTLDKHGITYTEADGTIVEGPATAPSADKGGWIYNTPAGLLTLTGAPCRDSMSGMPYPFTATLDRDGQSLPACAGDPASLLAGDWTATTVADAALPDGVSVTLSFSDGRIAGESGCNRFTGTVTLTGEGLSIGPLAATKMACPVPMMETERAVFTALAATTTFDVADRTLTLAKDDGTILIKAKK